MRFSPRENASPSIHHPINFQKPQSIFQAAIDSSSRDRIESKQQNPGVLLGFLLWQGLGGC
jgi:hypothetical protein